MTSEVNAWRAGWDRLLKEHDAMTTERAASAAGLTDDALQKICDAHTPTDDGESCRWCGWPEPWPCMTVTLIAALRDERRRGDALAEAAGSMCERLEWHPDGFESDEVIVPRAALEAVRAALAAYREGRA